MGLLDDAIREHLDLKRRRGADPAQVDQQEREALGPVRRNREPGDSAAAEPPAAAADAGLAGGAAYADEMAAPHPADTGYPDEPGHPAYAADDGYSEDAEYPPQAGHPGEGGYPGEPPYEGEPGYETEPGYEDEAGTEWGEPGPPAAAPPADWADEGDFPAETPPARAPDPHSLDHLEDATVEYHVPTESADDSDEDMLEETPEFLQDTPDHDRLWFEQRPPRDFDFDN